MNYVTKNFKEFLRNKLNEVAKKPEPEPAAINDNRPITTAWIYEMQEKFNEICKDYDDLSKLQ